MLSRVFGVGDEMALTRDGLYASLSHMTKIADKRAQSTKIYKEEIDAFLRSVKL